MEIPGSLLQKNQQDRVCCHPHYAERIIQTSCLKSLLHNSLLSSPLLYGSHSIALRINIILTSHKPMNTILQDPLQRKSSRKLELPSTTKGLSTKGCICKTPFQTVLQGENYPNEIEGTFYQSPPHLRNSNGSLFQAHYSLGSKNQNKRNWKLKILATNDLRSYDSKCFLVKEYFTFPSNFRQNSDLHSLVDHIHGTFHLLGGLLEPVLQHNQLALCGHPDPVPNIITYQHTIPNFEKEHTHNPNISAKCKL